MTRTVTEFIETKFKGRALEPLEKGQHSEAYKFEIDGSSYILRTSPKQDHFLRDKFVASHWPELDPPEVIEVGVMDGGNFYAVTRFVDGEVFASGWEFNDKVDPQDIKESFVTSMLEVSSVDVSSTTGYGKILDNGNGEFDSWRAFLIGAFENPKVKTAINKQVDAGQMDGKLIELSQSEVMEILTDSPAYETRHLLHGDFQPHNIIVKDNEVEAILDWGNAKYGDFAYDMMWYSMHGPEVASLEELVAAYEDSELDTTNLEHRLRLCKISILISWAMFSNELGNFDSAKSDQAQLRELLSA